MWDKARNVNSSFSFSHEKKNRTGSSSGKVVPFRPYRKTERKTTKKKVKIKIPEEKKVINSSCKLLLRRHLKREKTTRKDYSRRIKEVYRKGKKWYCSTFYVRKKKMRCNEITGGNGVSQERKATSYPSNFFFRQTLVLSFKELFLSWRKMQQQRNVFQWKKVYKEMKKDIPSFSRQRLFILSWLLHQEWGNRRKKEEEEGGGRHR